MISTTPFHRDYSPDFFESWDDFDDSPPEIRHLMNEFGYDAVLDAMMHGCFQPASIVVFLMEAGYPKPLRSSFNHLD